MENQQQEVQQEPTAPKEVSRFMSPTISKIVSALARAQSKYKPLAKNCEGKVSYGAKDGREAGGYKFRYADLGAVLEATSEALSSEELAHTVLIGAGRIRVMLLHSSGEWFASEAPIGSPEEMGFQKFGAQITYLRRYLFAPLVDLASEDDDDANMVEGNHFDKTTTKASAPPKQAPSAPATAPMNAVVFPLASSATVDDVLAALKSAGIEGKVSVLGWVAKQLGHPVESTKELSSTELLVLHGIAKQLPLKGKA